MPQPRGPGAARSDGDGGSGVTRRVYESAASRTAVEWHLCLLPTQGGHRVPAWAALTAACSGAPFAGASLRCCHTRCGLEQNPGHRPPGVSARVPQNASEHLPLLPPARPGRSTNVLGVFGKALSLNGIKLTVLQDPHCSHCLPGKAPAGSSGLRSLCLGTAPAAGRASTSCRGDFPHPGMESPVWSWGGWGVVLQGGLGAQGQSGSAV